MSSYKIVVFIDIPDPDNILMLLDVLNAHPQEQIAVALSPRIVDLSVPRYGEEFGSIIKEVELKKLALPIENEYPQDVSEPLQKWFYKDANLSDPEVMLDTMLYVKVSSLRIAQILQDHGVVCSRYKIFLDKAGLKAMKRPDMRHAFHVHDFMYGFDKEEMKEYKKCTDQFRDRGVNLRKGLRRIIYKYMTRQVGELALNHTDDKLTDFTELLRVNEHRKGTTLIIGGPLTEALTYLKRTPKPRQIFAMFASIRNDRNISNNIQFNFWKDMESAKKFLHMIEEHKINLYVVPTECGKGTKEKTCPFELSLDQYKDILKRNSLLYFTIKQYKEDTDRRDTYSAFDWLAAIIATDSHLFKWYKVILQEELKDGVENILVKRVKDHHKSTIRMAWDNYEYMQSQKDALISRMRKTFE
jgi:hypothetical protein